MKNHTSLKMLLRFGICALGFHNATFAQDANKTVPSDEEVKLLLTQADRAMSQYTTLVAQEKALLGDTADVATDEKLIRSWTNLSKAISSQPEKFNTVAGFDLVTMLDDASRNAGLASTTVASEVVMQITGGKVTPKTDQFRHAFGKCELHRNASVHSK